MLKAAQKLCCGLWVWRVGGVGVLVFYLSYRNRRRSTTVTMATSFQVEIPSNGTPGTAIKVQAPNGVAVQFVVPQSAQPGSKLTLAMPAAQVAVGQPAAAPGTILCTYGVPSGIECCAPPRGLFDRPPTEYEMFSDASQIPSELEPYLSQTEWSEMVDELLQLEKDALRKTHRCYVFLFFFMTAGAQLVLFLVTGSPQWGPGVGAGAFLSFFFAGMFTGRHGFYTDGISEMANKFGEWGIAQEKAGRGGGRLQFKGWMSTDRDGISATDRIVTSIATGGGELRSQTDAQLARVDFILA